jgi:hypothetical protein
MQIDQQEKQKLAKKFREELAKQKADEMGVNVDDLMMRVSNGKLDFVHKSKVYVELEKQRQLSNPKEIIRSLRGENSLVSRIRKEVELCSQTVMSTPFSTTLPPLELADYRTSINKLLNRCDNLHHLLQEAEDKIEHTKKNNPVFKQGEAVLVELHKAKQANELEKMTQLGHAQKDLLEQYATLRKGLEPHMAACRRYRLDLQREYWRILFTRWKMESTYIVSLRKQLKEAHDQMPDKTDQENLAASCKELVTQLDQLTKIQAELAERCPPKNIEELLATGTFDAILPDMKSCVDQITRIEMELAALLAQSLNDKEDDKGQSSNVKRMAYVSKK